VTAPPLPAADHAVSRTHIAVGGALGSLLRAGIIAAAVVAADDLEVVAILGVNLLGAFALGWLLGRARRDPAWARLVPLLGTGLLGAFTTFSALADQVARWLVTGAPLRALALGVVSLVAGLALAWLGLRLGGRGEGGVGGPAGDRDAGEAGS
jgi:fluoride exporter